MDKTLTHGSLFAGIGGFESAAKEAGIKTLWSCEIEPYPRLVLKARFPNVKQYGDIRKLRGANITPVDIITFGSPCQSFSHAGARQGLDGASGLFYEAVRVISEMHEATGGQYPKYAIMENVPGIYSSKSGGRSDFREVLNELLKIADKAVDVPLPKSGKFLNAGAIVGDNYSLAWRTLCASKFGVAQRRRRMFLVVDFTGGRATEILSEQESQRRDFTPGYLKGQGSAGSAAVGSDDIRPLQGTEVVAFEPGALKRVDKSVWEDQARTIRADMGDNQTAVAYPLDLRNAVRKPEDTGQGTGVGGEDDSAFTITTEYQHGVAVIENHPQDARLKIRDDGLFPAITQQFGTGGNNTHFVLSDRKPSAAVTDNIVGAIAATDYKGAPVYCEPRAVKLPYNICSDASNSMKSNNPDSGIYEADAARTLDGNGGSPSCNQGGTVIAIQGNVINRKDENGPAGIGYRQDKAYTVNTVDNGGAVCYQETVGALCASDFKGIRNQDIDDNKAVVETFGNNGYGKWNSEPAALKASGGDYPGGENLTVENKYAVRRLTPLECLRLQGLPDNHLDNIHIEEPTPGDIEYWRGAWAEFGKKKSENQIRKWLKDPYGDSNAYKAIGNSLAVPCALFVLRGIAEDYTIYIEETVSPERERRHARGGIVHSTQY